MKYKVLVVDDDVAINEMLVTYLKRNGYDVGSAYSGTEAILLIKTEAFDLVILDLMLPGLSGEQVLEKIKEIRQTPVIGLSAKDDSRSKIELIRNGADDYITKPFDLEELHVRMEAVLRRVYASDYFKASVIHCGELCLDMVQLSVTLKGQEIHLTKNEFAIMQMMMEHPQQVFTKDIIYEKLWNETFEGTENAINVHISNIRKKLSAVDSSRQYIKTVWGIGFKLEI